MNCPIIVDSKVTKTPGDEYDNAKRRWEEFCFEEKEIYYIKIYKFTPVKKNPGRSLSRTIGEIIYVYWEKKKRKF